MTALVLSQVPDPHIPSPITANQLPLVRVNNHIIHRDAMGIVPLHIAAARIPDLDRAVFARRHQPLGLAVECDARDVGRVTVEGEDGVGVRRFDIVELDGMMAGRGEVALVGRDAEAVYLGVGVWDGARADAAESFPESWRVVLVQGVVRRKRYVAV